MPDGHGEEDGGEDGRSRTSPDQPPHPDTEADDSESGIQRPTDDVPDERLIPFDGVLPAVAPTLTADGQPHNRTTPTLPRCESSAVTADRYRPRSWGWLAAVVVIEVSVTVGGLMITQSLVTDPGWVGSRSVYLVMAVVLLGTAVYVTWRSRHTDGDRRGQR